MKEDKELILPKGAKCLLCGKKFVWPDDDNNVTRISKTELTFMHDRCLTKPAVIIQ